MNFSMALSTCLITVGVLWIASQLVRTIIATVRDSKGTVQCQGCPKRMKEGEGTTYCESRCVCLGAVYCDACYHQHADRVDELTKECV